MFPAHSHPTPPALIHTAIWARDRLSGRTINVRLDDRAVAVAEGTHVAHPGTVSSIAVIRRGLAVLELVGQQRGHAADRGIALLSTEGERASLIAIACPVFSSFSLDERQWIETMAFHRFAVRPPLDHHRCFHTPPVHFSTLATPRKRPLSAEAQAGGGVAVSQALACHRCFPRMFPPCSQPRSVHR
jgi:hypothetical protein